MTDPKPHTPEPESAEDRAAMLRPGVGLARYMTRDELLAMYPDSAEDRIVTQRQTKPVSDKCGIPEDDE